MSTKQRDIEDLPKLSIENFENIFNVYKDEKGMYFYNLLNSIIFPKNLPSSLFSQHVIAAGDSWPLISYKYYNTPNLWWIILLANDITNPILFPKVGTLLLIPTNDVVREILNQLN